MQVLGVLQAQQLVQQLQPKPGLMVGGYHLVRYAAYLCLSLTAVSATDN